MWPFSSTPASPPPADASASADKCPVDHTTRQAWLANANAGSSSPHPFNPSASTSSPTASSSRSQANLSPERVVSSIPRGSGPSSPQNNPVGPSPEGHAPAHQDAEGNWVYPSEQQFFNAMLRKKHSPRAEDMRTVVPIHNAVNEKAWEEVLKWESPFGSERCGGPKLVSFVGRPKDMSPKAWFKTGLGYTPPFDRHDWIIDRCGTQVRYVIDFYTGRAGVDKKLAFYLDVRPAVDDWEGIKTRVTGWWTQK
ncbi:hypothetical protein IAT38_004303 [Cryptococcus sp. DSM 104549]